MDGWINGWMDGYVDVNGSEQIDVSWSVFIYKRCMDGQTDGWINGILQVWPRVLGYN